MTDSEKIATLAKALLAIEELGTENRSLRETCDQLRRIVDRLEKENAALRAGVERLKKGSGAPLPKCGCCESAGCECLRDL